LQYKGGLKPSDFLQADENAPAVKCAAHCAFAEIITAALEKREDAFRS
jgi:hypothetical protein